MENRGLVSVVVPVYNSEKYLKKCLDSIFAQTYTLLEVICINDGSTDASLAILEQYRKKFEYKMIIKSIENAGQANARNLGIEIASGEYICFVDSDDMIHPNMLDKMVNSILENKTDLITCGIERIFEVKPTFLEKHFQYDTYLTIDTITTIYDHPEIICFLTVAPFAKLIRKSFLDQHKIRFIKGYIYEDLVFTQTILSANPKIKILKDKLYQYLVRVNSTMTSKHSRVTDMFISYDNFYKEYEKREIQKRFQKELDYLCFYHVLVGTSYRMWRSGKSGLLQSIKVARTYCTKHECNKRNQYIKKKGYLTRLFIFLFASRV